MRARAGGKRKKKGTSRGAAVSFSGGRFGRVALSARAKKRIMRQGIGKRRVPNAGKDGEERPERIIKSSSFYLFYIRRSPVSTV